jgi:hypothetical protein
MSKNQIVLKKLLKIYFRIGSVNGKNSAGLIIQKDIDGFLVNLDLLKIDFKEKILNKGGRSLIKARIC